MYFSILDSPTMKCLLYLYMLSMLHNFPSKEQCEEHICAILATMTHVPTNCHLLGSRESNSDTKVATAMMHILHIVAITGGKMHSVHDKIKW